MEEFGGMKFRNEFYRPFDSRVIANHFIRLAEVDSQSMSIMRILKIVYLVHGWTLAIQDRPLVNEFVQAWQYGPVIPGFYYSFRPYGVYNLNPLNLVYEDNFCSETEDLMQ